MNPQTKALILRYLTGAAVAALGGAVGAATTMLDAGSVTDYRTLGAAMIAGALLALRLWVAKQTAGFASIIGLQKSLDDKLVESPDNEGGLLYKEFLPDLENGSADRPALFAMDGSGLEGPGMVEVRRFSDPRLQEAVESVFLASGFKNGAVINVDLNGEIRAGLVVKKGGHLTFSGFLAKKPHQKIEGLAQVAFGF